MPVIDFATQMDHTSDQEQNFHITNQFATQICNQQICNQQKKNNYNYKY